MRVTTLIIEVVVAYICRPHRGDPVPLEFHQDFWHQKTRVLGLSHGVVGVILGLAVLVEHRLVTDTVTDRQTDT